MHFGRKIWRRPKERRVGSVACGAERLANLYLWWDQRRRNHTLDLGHNWFNEKVSSSSVGTFLDIKYRMVDRDEVARGRRAPT